MWKKHWQVISSLLFGALYGWVFNSAGIGIGLSAVFFMVTLSC
jgi:hypothetical protein